jgi:hypothetical protein
MPATRARATRATLRRALVVVPVVLTGALALGPASHLVRPTWAAAATIVAAGPAGDANPSLDPVPAGKVAVVAASAPADGKVAVIVQNGTDHPVAAVRVRGAATSGGGGVATSTRRVAVVPSRLAPGSYGFAALDFRRQGVPAGAELTYRVTARRAASAADPQALGVGALARSAPMSGPVAQTLAFPVTNATGRAAKGPIRATVMCFNEAGKPVNVTTAKVRAEGLAKGATFTGTVRLAQLCPAALVMARSA